MITKERAFEYTTRKVAQIIYDTVECQRADRAALDWAEAEHLVQTHLGWLVARLCGTPLDSDTLKFRYSDPDPQDKVKFFAVWQLSETATFEGFDRKFGRVMWDNVRSLRQYLPRPPYGKVTFS